MSSRLPGHVGSPQRDSGEPGRSRVSSMLRLLWPEPCTIEWSRGPSGDGTPYAVVPNCVAPVIIAPRRPRRAMAARIRGYNTATHGRSRVKACLAAIAASTGAMDYLFPCAWIDDSAADAGSSIRKHLAQLLGQEVDLSVSIGPPRAVQKPVIQVAHGAGAPVAFAKIGHNPATGDLVVQETVKLRHIGTRLRSQHTVDVPTVISAGPWRDLPVLVQSAMAAGHTPTHEQITATVRTIGTIDGVRRAALESSSYLVGLHHRVWSLPSTRATASIRSAMTAIHQARAEIEIGFGSWHGDLTPWNLTAGRDTVRVWDWEHYGTGVPIGFDLLHYNAHRAVHRRGADATDAMGRTLADAPRELAGLGVTHPAARWVALLYTVDIATRYARDHEESGATPLGSLAWFEPVVQRQLADLRADQ